MALSERGKNIRFAAIASTIVAIIAAVLFVFFFDFSKSHKLKMGGYEITEGGIRELRVEATVYTHDYLIWEDEISGTVDVFEDDEGQSVRIERFQMVRRNNRYLPKRTTEEAYQEDRWREKVRVHTSSYRYTAYTNGPLHGDVVVDDDMEWLVVTTGLFSDVKPRILVFATDRDVGYDVAKRAIAQIYREDGQPELQNPYE